MNSKASSQSWLQRPFKAQLSTANRQRNPLHRPKAMPTKPCLANTRKTCCNGLVLSKKSAPEQGKRREMHFKHANRLLPLTFPVLPRGACSQNPLTTAANSSPSSVKSQIQTTPKASRIPLMSSRREGTPKLVMGGSRILSPTSKLGRNPSREIWSSPSRNYKLRMDSP